MKRITRQMIFQYAPVFIYTVSLAVLLFSVITSGYYYLFDIDEMNHMQRAYLILQGDIPFISYYSIYTPVYQWFILPVLTFFGQSFLSFYAMRVVMIVLFLLRLSVIYILCKKIFGITVARVWLLLYLLDPITVFTSMQIRPDNLMLLLFLSGVMVLVYPRKSNTKKKMFFVGFLLSLSLVVHIKMLPSVFVVSVVLFLYQAYTKNIQPLFSYILGGLIPVVIFVLYSFVTGSFEAMVQQVVLDPTQTLGELMYPAQYGRFFRPGNYNLFGTSVFKPLNWLYVWVLPWLGFAGGFIALIRTLEKIKKTKKGRWVSIMTVCLFLVMLMQWLWLFTVHSVFIQYYLPVTWVFAMFGAYALSILVKELLPYKKVYYPVAGIGLIVFILFFRQGVNANFTRSTIRETENIEQIEKLWKIIPKDAAVYPRLIFRPSGHPLGTAQFYVELPEKIKNRYGTLEHWLDRYEIPYLLLSYYEIDQYGPAFQEYMKENYKKVPTVESLYERR